MVVQTTYPTQKAPKHTRIPMRIIRALAKIIAEKFNPEEIILFGSHAYGRPHAWSDVDFLVVMETPRGEVKTIMEISDSLRLCPLAWTLLHAP
jgi:predicted nucleotidyltransferase